MRARRDQLFEAFLRQARDRYPVNRDSEAYRPAGRLGSGDGKEASLHVELRQAGDVVIVDLKGKLTLGLGDQILRDTIDELLAENRRKILLNLSEVSFIDSAGVGELVAGLRTARRVGAALKLLKASERVHSTLFIARLLPIFELYPTRPRRSPTSERGARAHSSSSTTRVGFSDTIRSSIEHSGQLIVSPTSSS